jgi:putative transposase
MAYNPGVHHRRSTRLKDYDYSQPGSYFVTLCVKRRECLLGEIIAGGVELNALGLIAKESWLTIPDHFPNTIIDSFIVMPNHAHAIVDIQSAGRGVVTTPLHEDPDARPALGRMVAYYKYQTTIRINILRHCPGTAFWQRNYYDHIIRNDRELTANRCYIVDNPMNWELDRDNPKNL